jgi:hypothetical protein
MRKSHFAILRRPGSCSGFGGSGDVFLFFSIVASDGDGTNFSEPVLSTDVTDDAEKSKSLYLHYRIHPPVLIASAAGYCSQNITERVLL